MEINIARILKNKELENTRLAANYGGWMYCSSCNENIGYLCYSTYDSIHFSYKCACGSEGTVHIDFDDSCQGTKKDAELSVIKNRLCCPTDHEPLMTVLDKKLLSYVLEITCKTCGSTFSKIKKEI